MMAIVNRTPDSFYDRGAAFADDAALARVDAAVAEGADIIDIGGVKAGPGRRGRRRRGDPPGRCRSSRAVRDRHPDVVISVDTWRARGGPAGRGRGRRPAQRHLGGCRPDARRGGRGDRRRHRLLAHRRAPCRAPARTGCATPTSSADVHRRRVRAGRAAGRARRAAGGHPHRPHPRLRQEHLPRPGPAAPLRRAGGHRLAGADGAVQQGLRRRDARRRRVTERLEGTLAATALAAAAGARVFRAHEVAATRRTVDMVAAILGNRPPARTVRALA